MKRGLQQGLLLIILVLIPSISLAGSNESISGIGSAFDFNEVTQKSSIATPTYEERIALIDNNLKYVLITAALYAFSLIIITMLMRITPGHEAKDIVTIIGLVSVIFTSILLVLVVDTTDALTAPMGILGAIAGYLFGTAQKKESSKEG